MTHKLMICENTRNAMTNIFHGVNIQEFIDGFKIYVVSSCAESLGAVVSYDNISNVEFVNESEMIEICKDFIFLSAPYMSAARKNNVNMTDKNCGAAFAENLMCDGVSSSFVNIDSVYGGTLDSLSGYYDGIAFWFNFNNRIEMFYFKNNY